MEKQRVFRLKSNENCTTEKMIIAGNYDYVNRNVNGKNFPMRPRLAGTRIIEMIKFNHESTSEDVIAEAKRRGLERPTYEDALNFGEQFPEKQKKQSLPFLHEPWRGPGGRRDVIVLDGGPSGRGLSLGWFGGKWARRCAFPFVRIIRK